MLTQHPESTLNPGVSASGVKRDLATHARTPKHTTVFTLSPGEEEVLQVLVRVFDLTSYGMTDRQMRKFLTWTRDPVESVRMNLRNISIYAQQREGRRDCWWLGCRLDFFLKSWPKILKIVQADDVVTRAMNDDAFLLACIACSQPEQFLNIQTKQAAEHLAGTRFVRRGVETKDWLIAPGDISKPVAQVAFYMANLRNPAIAPFMSSTDANGVVTAARAGFDMVGNRIRDARAALDSHLIVMLVESTRRNEHWPELDNDWVRQQTRRMIHDSEPLRRVLEHFGVFRNYRDVGLLDVARRAAAFDLEFCGRLASLHNALEYSSLDYLNSARRLLKPFFHA